MLMLGPLTAKKKGKRQPETLDNECESLEAIQRPAIRIIYPVTVSMPYIFALSYAQIPSLHSRREDTDKRFLGLFFTLTPAFFPCYLHKEIALLLLDYDLQLYILGQLLEQNVLHLQFSIFC